MTGIQRAVWTKKACYARVGDVEFDCQRVTDPYQRRKKRREMVDQGRECSESLDAGDIRDLSVVGLEWRLCLICHRFRAGSGRVSQDLNYRAKRSSRGSPGAQEP